MRDGGVKEWLTCMRSISEKWWHWVREGNPMRPAFVYFVLLWLPCKSPVTFIIPSTLLKTSSSRATPDPDSMRILAVITLQKHRETDDSRYGPSTGLSRSARRPRGFLTVNRATMILKLVLNETRISHPHMFTSERKSGPGELGIGKAIERCSALRTDERFPCLSTHVSDPVVSCSTNLSSCL